MARNRKQRRQQHGSAWHWKQTDCWYYTEPGTKKRVSLFDEKGERIRGKESKEAAGVALARIKVADELNTPAPAASNEWTAAKVCDVYLADLHRSANPEWAIQVENWLNNLCGYCGALKSATPATAVEEVVSFQFSPHRSMEVLYGQRRFGGFLYRF